MRQTAEQQVNKNKQSKRFSLKTKSAIVILLLLSSISLIQVWFVHQYQRQQFDVYLQTKRIDYDEALNRHVISSFYELSSLSDYLSALQRNEPAFDEWMRQNWVDTRAAWNLTGYFLYSYGENEKRRDLELGNSTLEHLQALIDKTFELKESQRLIHCSKQCYLLLTKPYLVNNNLYVSLLIKSTTELLDSFKQSTQLNNALLFRKTINGQALEQVQLLSEKEQDVFQQIIKLRSTSLKALNVGQLKMNGQEYYFWLNRLDNSNQEQMNVQTNIEPWLITIFDTTELAELNSNFWNQVLFILLSVLFLFSGIFIWLVMKPIRKIERLSRIYPALANREFKIAKNELPLSKKRYPDEVDILFEKTGNMIDSLIELDSSIIRKESELEYLASHDELTGLGNRNMLRYAVERLMKELEISSRHWALIYIDLDNFKQVNDSLGHESGDALLCQVAKRLKQSVRNHDQVMRLGGDEFTIVVDYLNSRNEVTIILEKVFEALSNPITVKGVKINVEFSAGAYASNDNHLTLEDIIKRSDLAMYQAKASGKNQYQIFEDSMLLSAERTFLIINEFDRSIDKDHFSLVYQPQFNASSLELVGFEALVRWQHAKHGAIGPYEFIPILEESERISLLGRFVAKTAIRDHAIFLQYSDNIQMAINLSPRQLYDEKLASFLLENCHKQGVSTGLIELELTEHSIVKNFSHAKQWMEHIIKLGFKMAIDDFGTGYSSLSSLNQLFFNSVKLDRSFISGMENSIRDKELLASVINLVSRINSKIIAEGVELESQHKYLKDIHCHWVQGYLFAKPMPIEDIIPMLEIYKNSGAWPTIAQKITKQ
ncbi:MAG: bifunctional diguanylate cyclase/phosphodiesterase [Gammaproteobacteria bacterium]|nr:bifunctional diguanylate cyclase/phosphodiesterase [Gammaproteobacteria bacterium]